MQDLTTGSVSSHLLKTTSFMLVTMVFQTLYFLVDLYWVGSLGKEAVAAVAVSGNLMFVVLGITQMLGVGATTLVSHAVGRQDKAQAQLACNQAQVLAVVVGVVFLVLMMALRVPYANTLSADAVTAANTAAYLGWFVPAMALQFVIGAQAAALRGTGNFKPGMIVQTATIIINMILAPVLIFGWVTHAPMGVAGAALATFVAVAVGVVWLAFYFLPAEAYLRLVPSEWKPQLGLWRRLLAIGLPAGAEFGLMAVYLFIVYSITRPFGSAAQAGFGIGLRVVQAGFMPVVALAFSVAPVAGQNFGARKPDRVRDTLKSALLLSVAWMVFLGVICYLIPAAMIGIFSADPQVKAVGSEYLRIIAWNFVPAAVVFVNSSMFQAIGNTIPPLVASFVRIVLVAIPAFVMARMPGFELNWIWYLSVAAIIVQMILSLWLLRREFRIRLDGLAPLATGPAPAVAA
jgi:MATE family, multidrug efflux pump